MIRLLTTYTSEVAFGYRSAVAADITCSRFSTFNPGIREFFRNTSVMLPVRTLIHNVHKLITIITN